MKITKRQLRKIIKEEMRHQRQLDEAAIDWLQGGLDIAGLVPGVGEAADGLNAIISLGRGNPLEALLSGISMIPVAGDAVGKGGKLVLKILDPAMDMIKAGGKMGDIVKKIGPEKIKKAKGAINLVKDTVVKYKPQLKQGFKAMKDADLESVEELIGVKIPGPAREKAAELLKKSSEKVDQDGISSVMDFLSNLDPDEVTGGKGEEPHGEEKKLAAGYNPRGYLFSENTTILGHLMGDDYINEQLKDFSKYMRKLK